MELGAKSGGLGDASSPVGSRANPGRGSGGPSPPKAGTFKKIHNLKSCENERHDLMLLMAFFIAVHTGLAVIFGMC